MTQQISRFMAKTTIYHGIGSRDLVGEEATKLGISRALLVCDPGVRKAGLLGGVEKQLSKSSVAYEVYDEVEEDADVNTVHELASIIRESGCDGVVVVGGGSAMCAAKGAALEATNDVRSIRELEGLNQYKVPPLPVLCLPTTAGSGTDVSWGFPIVDEERGREFSVAGEHIQPPVSLLDPYFLKTCPRWPMIFAGLDALTHAVEALWGIRATILTDALAYEAIRLIMGNLREAVLTKDVEAMSNQLLASVVANFAGGNASMGVIHGIAISVGNLKGPHGFKCGMLLPHGIEFNMTVCEEKFAKIATILGETPSGKTTSELAKWFLHQVKQLLADLDFPPRFGPENLARERIPHLINEVRKHVPPFLETNLRPVADDDVTRICEAALKGWD
jgi:alcohol dehydrogenase class IV